MALRPPLPPTPEQAANMPPTPGSPTPPSPSTLPPMPTPESVEGGENSGENPPVEKSYSDELEFWQQRMMEDSRKLARRNLILRILLGVGALAFFGILAWIHQATIGRYAVLKDIQITQNPCNQGQLDITFEVVKPGKVLCRRTSGDSRTDLVDVYYEPGVYQRPWSWNYVPGSSISVSIRSRSGLWFSKKSQDFPTANRIDVVILIDATGSMDTSLKALQDRCGEFASRLQDQSLTPRFALVGFGDTGDGEWVETLAFTSDIAKFQEKVESLRRYDGGVDLEESSIDALAEAVALVGKEKKSSVRRFYLVTDAGPHPTTADGKYDIPSMAKLLREKGILLDIFSRPEYEEIYAPLLGETGNYREIENFGMALAQGRVLED